MSDPYRDCWCDGTPHAPEACAALDAEAATIDAESWVVVREQPALSAAQDRNRAPR